MYLSSSQGVWGGEVVVVVEVMRYHQRWYLVGLGEGDSHHYLLRRWFVDSRKLHRGGSPSQLQNHLPMEERAPMRRLLH